MKTLNLIVAGSILGLAGSAFAGTTIAQQNFDNPDWLGGQYTDTGDPAVDHDLVNNPGEAFVDGGGGANGIAFDAYYRNTRNDVGLTDGDFVGVTNFTGDVGFYTSGDQGYQISDPDGVMGVAFAPVDISGAVAPSISLDYFVNDTGFESDDLLRVWVEVDGGTEIDLVNLADQALEDQGALNAWENISLDLTGFTTVSLNIELDANSGSEAVYFDSVLVSDIPAPGALALLGVAGLAARRRRRA